MRKTPVKMNKPVYLGLSFLSLSNIRIYESCYNYIKENQNKKAKLHYIDTIKTEDFYEDISKHVAKTFDTSNYSNTGRLLLLRKSKIYRLNEK